MRQRCTLTSAGSIASDGTGLEHPRGTDSPTDAVHVCSGRGGLTQWLWHLLGGKHSHETLPDGGTAPGSNGAASGQTGVLVADSHPPIRIFLRHLLASASDLTLIAEACSGREAIQLVQEQQPEILLLEAHLPSISGLEVVRAAREALPTIRTVVLTGYGSAALVRQLLAQHVDGLLSKTAEPEEILDALRLVQAGERYVQDDLARLVCARDEASTPGPTDRELAVLQLVAQGLPNKEVAEQLTIRERTVRFHLEHLTVKLGATSRTDLLRRAHEAGWLTWVS